MNVKQFRQQLQRDVQHMNVNQLRHQLQRDM